MKLSIRLFVKLITLFQIGISTAPAATAVCGNVYLQNIRAHTATVVIDSRRCEPLNKIPEHAYLYGRGLIVNYGTAGEHVVVYKSTQRVLRIPVEFGTLSALHVLNTGPGYIENEPVKHLKARYSR